MRRLVLLWLPHWKTERLERAQRRVAPVDKPRQSALAIAETGKGGRRLIAVNQAAEAAGVSCGMAVTDAHAILPALKTAPASPREEGDYF
jgi:protein ImuB